MTGSRFSRCARTSRVEADDQGLGDIGLSARFTLTDPHRGPLRVNALTLISLPSGKVETGFLDENIVLGVGAISVHGQELRALIVWEPVIASDMGPPAVSVLSRLSDPRPAHYGAPVVEHIEKVHSRLIDAMR